MTAADLVLGSARALLGTAGPVATGTGPGRLPPDQERLRDFHLPTRVWSRPSADDH